MVEKYCDKPRMCNVLNVEVDERFYTQGWSRLYEFHVDVNGDLIGEDGDYADPDVICNIINDPSLIIRQSRWSEHDVADARAVKRIFPDVTHVSKRGNVSNFGYFSEQELHEDEYGNATEKIEKPKIIFNVPESATCFLGLKSGEEVKLDDILNRR